MKTRRGRRAAFAALGVAGLLALWQIIFLWGGPFVLPPPADAVALVFKLVRDGALWGPAAATTLHVVIGFAAGAALGLVLGFAGGAIDDLGAALDAVSTIILGVPPIIWIVLALLWFGPDGVAPSFTVAIGIAPVVFAGAIAGVRASSPELDELAAAFNAPPQQRLHEIRLPQASVALLPALATALGLAWKIALMAEVLGGGEGIGGRIADARAHLDTTETMAWVVIALTLLLATDMLLARAADSTVRLS